MAYIPWRSIWHSILAFYPGIYSEILTGILSGICIVWIARLNALSRKNQVKAIQKKLFWVWKQTFSQKCCLLLLFLLLLLLLLLLLVLVVIVLCLKQWLAGEEFFHLQLSSAICFSSDAFGEQTLAVFFCTAEKLSVFTLCSCILYACPSRYFICCFSRSISNTVLSTIRAP